MLRRGRILLTHSHGAGAQQRALVPQALRTNGPDPVQAMEDMAALGWSGGVRGAGEHAP